MWRLSKLKLRGFKSFAESSQIVFPAGITAVVGPNGCGKSNISDAIVWALGEQSTNALRAQRMQDVIFQGSAHRKGTGLAEVTLYLTNGVANDNGNGTGRASGNGLGPSIKIEAVAAADQGNGSGPVVESLAASEPEEPEGAASTEHPRDSSTADIHGVFLDLSQEESLNITRRLYRSGDSEYLLNGKRCRLRDIRERLLGTGLGSRACFTIEQGKIDQVLSASPVDRRGPIEEAAGISLYRRRRHATRLKLEASDQDLGRVEDICDEVGRQMRSLKRQAGRARRYRELRESLRQLERRWFVSELERVQRRRGAADAAVAGARCAEESAREELRVATDVWEHSRREWRRRRQQEATRQQQLYQARVELERLKAESIRHQDRAIFASERGEELQHRLEELRQRHTDGAEVVEARREAARRLIEMLEQANQRLQDSREHLVSIEGQQGSGDVAVTDGLGLGLQLLGGAIDVDDDKARGCVVLALAGLTRLPLLPLGELEEWLRAAARQSASGGGVQLLQAPDGRPRRPPDHRVKGPVLALVKASSRLQGALDAILGRTWIVDSPEEVLSLSRQHPEDAFVDSGGELWARGAELRWSYAAHTSDTRGAEGRQVDASEREVAVKQASLPLEVVGAADSTPLVAAERACEQAAVAHRTLNAQTEAASRELTAATAGQHRLESDIERTTAQLDSFRSRTQTARQETQRAEELALEAAERCAEAESEGSRPVDDGVVNAAEVAGLESALAATRQAIEVSQRRRSSLEVAAAETRVAAEHLNSQIEERLGISAQTLMAGRAADGLRSAESGRTEQEDQGAETVADDRSEDSVHVREQMQQIRAAIDRLGPVNLVAYDDLQEQTSRFEQLDAQRNDLRGAVANLEQAIREIDRQCLDRFEEAFEAINGYFNRIFRRLFGGGRAGISLQNPDDLLNSGIDIVAQPPGKRLQNIRLLSGGERSLVALALILAIFEYHPSPFCILDEADAALDDTNIARFVRALADFQQRAQFILITHNRRSMEAADLLYGVTMEESGVSKLMSVRMD